VRFINTLTHTYRVNYDRPVTPTLLFHAGVGFLRHVNPDESLPESRDYDPVAGLGLKGALYGKGFPVITGLSSVTGGGMSLPVGANQGLIWLNKPTIVLNATWIRNSHTYKIGGDWRIDSLTSRGAGGS